jgi:hypothetical protein
MEDDNDQIAKAIETLAVHFVDHRWLMGAVARRIAADCQLHR